MGQSVTTANRKAAGMQDDQEQVELRMRLAQLQLEHDDLHAAIGAMIAQRSDPLRVQRMKKKKLTLKDQIEKIASKVIPEIIA